MPVMTKLHSNGATAFQLEAGPLLRLRSDEPQGLLGVCPRCRVLLSFEIGLAPEQVNVWVNEEGEMIGLVRSRRGRPRKHGAPSRSRRAEEPQQEVLDAETLARRLIVYDRKVRLDTDHGKVRLVHAVCNTPLNLFR